MTRDETVKIIRIIVDSYPNYKPNNISETVDVWNEMLSEYSYNDIAVALKSYILSDKSGFAPSIGQLTTKLNDIKSPQQLNEMQAWSIVSKAIRNSTYNYVDEFDKLPELVKEAIGIPEQLRVWALDENYNEQVASSNFVKCYRNVLQRSKNYALLPKQAKMQIDHVSNFALIEQSKNRKHSEDTISLLETDFVEMPEECKRKLEELKNNIMNK